VTTFAEQLADGRVHVFDGAMGTELYARGVFINVCFDELSLRQSDLVREVHAAYVQAGAEILETNTFGANPVKLGQHGLAEQTEAINRRAAELAREAAGGRASVLGAIGPLGVRLEPFGPTSRVEAFEFFKTQAAALLAPVGMEITLYTHLGELPHFNPDLAGAQPGRRRDRRGRRARHAPARGTGRVRPDSGRPSRSLAPAVDPGQHQEERAEAQEADRDAAWLATTAATTPTRVHPEEPVSPTPDRGRGQGIGR